MSATKSKTFLSTKYAEHLKMAIVCAISCHLLSVL